MVFSLDVKGEYLMTAQGLNAKGESVVERPTRLVPDGQPHPIPDFPGLSTTTIRLDANTLQSEARREDGSVVGGGTLVVSPDGAWLTATNFGYDTQLRQFQQRTVWDRVDRPQASGGRWSKAARTVFTPRPLVAVTSSRIRSYSTTSPTTGGRPSSARTRPLTLSTSSWVRSRSKWRPSSSRRTVPATDADPSGAGAIDGVGRSLVDFADDFLEQIFETEHARRAAVLVDHDRQMRLRPLHRFEHDVERGRFGHDGHRPQILRADGFVRQDAPQQILDVQHADDVIEVAVVDGIARVVMRGEDPPNSRARRRPECRRPARAAPSLRRPCDRRIPAAREAGAPDSARKRAALGAFFDDDLQLFRRVDLLGVLLLAGRPPAEAESRRRRSARTTSG